MASFPEENFYRVACLVVNVIPTQLRNYFKDKWDANYPFNPWDDTGNSGKFFLQSEKKINDKGILKNIQNGDRNKWDGTTLFAVLLYSSHNLIKGDQNTRTCINNLRRLRNEHFAHVDSGKIDDKDCQLIFKDAENEFKQMGWPVTGINVTEAKVMDTQDYQKLRDELRKERANNTQLETKLDTANENLDEIKQIVEDLLREQMEGKVPVIVITEIFDISFKCLIRLKNVHFFL